MSSRSSASRHYDDRYFAWQGPIGEFGGWANVTKFTPFVPAGSDVLDFGCGGGYLLKNLDCRRRLGVEVNPAAARTAERNGVEVYLRTEDVPDNCCDFIISNNALEHTLDPLRELQGLRSKVREGGTLVFVVPCESIGLAYKPDDIHHHLYSWSPMCLGNLLVEAGYQIIECKPYVHKWPPGYRAIARLGGRTLFELACRAYGNVERSWFQVRGVALRPTS